MSIKTLIFLALADNLNYFKPKFRIYPELYMFLSKRSKSSVRAQVNELFYGGAIEKIIKNGITYLSLTQSGWNSFSQNFLAPLVGLKTPWDKKWRIVVFNVPESDRKKRDKLRRLLVEAKFARLSNSLYISPFPFRKSHGFRGDDIFTFEAQGFDDKKIANSAFGLAKLTDRYREWIKRTKDKEATPDTLISYYDSLLKTDPALPEELLPTDWPFPVSLRIFIGLVEKKRTASLRKDSKRFS